jgi:3',5'-cyclic AMP phosphodiesterase CpdA
MTSPHPRCSGLLLAGFVLICLAVPAAAATPAQLALLKDTTNIAAIQALKPQRDGSFSFVVMGDNRNGDETYKRLLAKINRYAQGKAGRGQRDPGYRPLFLLHTGDTVPSGAEPEWHNFAEMMSALELPAVFVPGNHEMRVEGGRTNFERFVGDGDWSFDFAGCRFIGLDDSTGVFSPESVSFLRRELGLDGAAPAPQRKFVAFHQPPYYGKWVVHSTKPDGEGSHSVEVMAAIAAAKTDAVLMGHIHLYDSEVVDGVPYIISAGGGAPLYSFNFGKSEYGFAVVHVGPRGVDWEWVPLEQAAAPAG